MKFYPLMINLNNKPVVVIGGGNVALRKVKSLLDCGALITLVSPKVEPQLEEIAAQGLIEWIPRAFRESDLGKNPPPALVFGTTDKREVNVAISSAATKLGIPCNIADVPDLCTFIVPAVVSRGDLTIAVSTGGGSPALARRIREDLQKYFGPEYAVMIELLGCLRQQIIQRGNSSDQNKKLFLNIVDSDLLTALKEHDRDKALAVLKAILPEDVNPEPCLDHCLSM